jgi:hypothetical protein
MPKRGKSDLEMTARQLAEARRTVEEQRRRIAKAKKAGKPTLDQEQTLRVCESILQIFEVYERMICGQGPATTVGMRSKARGKKI